MPQSKPPGMNPERYIVVNVINIPNRRKAYLQRAVRVDEPLPYCVYIGGNGHYFKTEAEMLEYLQCRKKRRRRLR